MNILLASDSSASYEAAVALRGSEVVTSVTERHTKPGMVRRATCQQDSDFYRILDGGNMNILSLLTNHSHYWGIPHERSSDKRLIQTCYECGAEREIKVDLRPTSVPPDPELEFHKPRAA